jgi:hypothetical protein
MQTSRAVLAFAYVAEQFGRTGDLATGLLPLFAPVIAKRAGQKFNPEQFATDVAEMYDIEMHPYVAEEFAPRLAAEGFLIQTANFHQNAAYENVQVELAAAPISEGALNSLLERFLQFAENLLRPVGVEISRQMLKDGLLDRLVQPDFLGLMLRPDRTSTGPHTLVLRSEPDADESASDTQRLRIDYLAARFILDMRNKSPQDFDLLVDISSGAVTAEVALTLQHPPGSGEDLADLRIVLDGPLIMDALGFGQDGLESGIQYARRLIESVKKAKAIPVIFQHTMEEVEGAIRSPVENYERGQPVYGHLGRRLLHNSTFAPYLRSVLRDLPQLVTDLGVQVLPFSNIDRAKARVFFTEKNEEKLSEEIGFYHNNETQLRDARSIADVLRIRERARAKTLKEAQILFVTRNGRLARLSRQFLLRSGLMSREYLPPCITDRYLAGLLWITQGGGGSHLSRERLISNCTAAISPRRDVVTKVHRFLENLSQVRADRFDALMTNERAEHFLMDRTIGDVTLIKDSNLEAIYRDVELIAGERVAAQKDEEMANLRSSHDAALATQRAAHEDAMRTTMEAAAEKLQTESTRLLQLEGQLAEERERKSEAEAAVQRLRSERAEHVALQVARCHDAGARAAKWARVRVGVTMLLISVALGLLTAFLPEFFPHQVIVITVVLIVITQTFTVANYLIYRETALDGYVRRCQKNASNRRAIELGVEQEVTQGLGN